MEKQSRAGELPEEEDDFCDLDSTKICDNCMKCVTGDADYIAVKISGIQLDHEQDDKKQGS